MDNSAHLTMFEDAHEASRRRSILDPSPNGQASHVAERFHGPIRAWAATTVVSFVVVASALIGWGLLLVAEILPEGLATWDRSIATWFVAQRTPTLNTATEIGSMLGSTFVVVGVGIVVGIALALRRHWREVGFLAAALLIEVGSFLAATFVVDRPRPTVPQLDVAPPTSSYPSGHTAAALVLYVSVAIIVWTLTDSRVLRVLFWTLAALVPIVVACSRLYRGMHHASDVVASVLLAAASLACAVMVTRVTTAAETHPVKELEPPRTSVSHEVPA